MDLTAYFQRLWRGRVTARENIGFFIPIWLWFAYLVWIEAQRLGENVLYITFLVVVIVSMVPFFLRRVGLIRWWLFGFVLPATVAAVAVQCLRSFFGH